MKKYVLGIVTGMLLMAVLFVGASIFYNAKDIEFNSNDNDWNVTNVEDALNYLYSDKSFKLVVYAYENTSLGTTWNNLDAFKITNDNYVKYDNGKYIFLKSGDLKVCTTSKAHYAGANASMGRLYKNNELIYSTTSNEVLRCDSISVKENDYILYQIASNATWGLGTLTIFYV